ncbi:MAG: heat-inducible transcription repressor HrcA [Deltaproteobacteria bacterium]|nr:heat-inducible transcription repressor HrcA [Deltaproteobacteria bacterium]
MNERNKKILNAVLEEYIHTAEPVGSKAVAESCGLGLSPATIRGLMAELESQGLLARPHASAGRIPTEKAFRFYVDGLPQPQDLSKGDKDALLKGFESADHGEGALKGTARSLATLTGCACLMFMPDKDNFIIREINIVRVDAGRVIVMIVSSLGVAVSRFLDIGIEAASLDIEKTCNYLNSIAGGLTVAQLRSIIVAEMRNEKNLYDELLDRALRLGAMALEAGGVQDNGLFVEGKLNVLDQPEFRGDVERMRMLFIAFEEKALLVKMLDKSMDDGKLRTYLGSESMIKEFEGLSFVTAGYGVNARSNRAGMLAVMGPVRMNYSKVIPLVNYTATLLSSAF